MKLAISIPGLFLLTVWTVGCLWFDGPESRLWAGALVDGIYRGRDRSNRSGSPGLAAVGGLSCHVCARAGMVAQH